MRKIENPTGFLIDGYDVAEIFFEKFSFILMSQISKRGSSRTGVRTSYRTSRSHSLFRMHERDSCFTHFGQSRCIIGEAGWRQRRHFKDTNCNFPRKHRKNSRSISNETQAHQCWACRRSNFRRCHGSHRWNISQKSFGIKIKKYMNTFQFL